MWNILVNIVNQALLSDGVTNEPLNHLFDFLYNRSCNFMFVHINLKVILKLCILFGLYEKLLLYIKLLKVIRNYLFILYNIWYLGLI